MIPKIEVKNLRKVYDTPERKVHALEDVNLQIQDGEFICLVGLSGCGKTTLLNILAGFVEITAGEVLMDGKKLDFGYDKGVVFQEYALFPHQTVEENLKFALTKKDNRTEVIKEIQDIFKLSNSFMKVSIISFLY